MARPRTQPVPLEEPETTPARLAGWAAASLVLHAVVLLPLLAAFVTAAPASGRAALASALDAEAPETPPTEPEVPLGLDVDRPMRATWVGYDEYREHLAELAEIEQAAFRATDAARPGDPGSAAPPPAPESAPAEEAPERPTSTPEPARDPLLELLRQVARAGPLDAPRTGDATEPRAPDMPSVEPVPAPPAPETPPDETPTPEPPSDEPADRPQTETPPAAAPGDGGADAPKPVEGDPSDRESQATSLEVPLDRVRLGQPLAGGGLELRPVAPRFTTLIELTVLPKNPVAELRIDREGKPTEVELVKGSGDPRVDEAVRSAFFRWRASGKPLEDLAEDERVTVRIRMILNPYAKD